MKSPRAEVYRDRRREFRWRFVAANGKLVANSGEGFPTRSRAWRAFRTAASLFAGPPGSFREVDL